MTSSNPVSCALLARFRNDWASTLMLMCPHLTFVTLSASTLGIREAPNPFALPERDRAEVILLTAYWYEWLSSHHPDRVEEVLRALARSAGALVAWTAPITSP